jgi:hypothetical protein
MSKAKVVLLPATTFLTLGRREKEILRSWISLHHWLEQWANTLQRFLKRSSAVRALCLITRPGNDRNLRILRHKYRHLQSPRKRPPWHNRQVVGRSSLCKRNWNRKIRRQACATQARSINQYRSVQDGHLDDKKRRKVRLPAQSDSRPLATKNCLPWRNANKVPNGRGQW